MRGTDIERREDAVPARSIAAVVLWMCGTLLSFSAVAVSVRELAGSFSVFEILTLRSLAGVVILAVLALAVPDLRAGLASRRLPLHALRNVVHFAGQYAWTLGITLLPLAVVFAIEFTTPAWVALLAVVVLGERMTRARLAAVALGFCGVLIVLRPGAAAFDFAALVVLGSALAFALTTVTTKALTGTESTFAILFWMNLMQLPMNYLGADPLFFTRLGDAALLPLAGVCIGGLSAHLCLTNAYRHGDATMVVPLDFLRLPLIALVGVWLYSEPLDPYVFLGAAVIVTGIVFNLVSERRPRTPQPDVSGR